MTTRRAPTRRAATAAAALAAAFACASPASAAKQDPVAAAAARALATLRATVRADDALHAAALRDALTALRRGTATPASVFGTHAAALAFLVEKADRAADVADAAFAGDVVAAMSETGDPLLRGAVPGDGGAADAFADAVRRELDRERRRVAARIASFARSFAKEAGGFSSIRTSLRPWDHVSQVAATSEGVVSGGDAPLAVWSATAARFPDSSVAVSVAGVASPAIDGAFDLRMRSAAVEPLKLLSDGGVAVTSSGSWSVGPVTFAAEPPVSGVRALQFGVEPFDGGLAGRQPSRLLHAGAIAIP